MNNINFNNENDIASSLLKKCRKTAAKYFIEEQIKEKESCDSFIKALIDGDSFNKLYEMLDDKISKSLYDKLIIHRYMLSFYPKSFYSVKRKLLFSFKYSTINIYKYVFKYSLFLMMYKFFYPQRIGSSFIFQTFVCKQYDVKDIFEVRNNSVVFDIGAFKGDTAIFFSKNTNENAKIYAFEPDANVFNILNSICKKHNLHNVITKNIFFSDKNEDTLFEPMMYSIYEYNKLKDKVVINSTTIDKYIEENNIEKIDFIKMDVEGAELSILKGAKNTIKKYRPHLAIAIYHGGDLFMEDFYTVPLYVKNITENYRYYIKTFTPWAWETILFCVPND